ncbi:hypothetical protein AKJ57_04845 [candidate division MSBL1 archaeon SCGC-AAA259A05]|uniref:Uncharacterized protein n=1 Tax=candidate division MSBL1 archaeon SCGC-AAA259A05 TaxID=1698259 RepID=A0A133U6H3_9EURY|nr:hypothetical protein AKJ57_04845 [candidate division MSBL1 archaeon SCGC-AAA259A05]
MIRCRKMGKCELCGREEDLLEVNHEEHGKIMVCRDCRNKISEEEQKVAGSSDSESGGPSLGCPHCG